MSQNPSDFFNSFEGSNNNGVQQRKAKPPPPPRRPTATSSSTVPSGSYYGGGASSATTSSTATRPTAASSVNQSVRQPPPKPRSAATTAQRPTTSSTSYYNSATFTPAPSNASTTSHTYPSTTATTAVPSYNASAPAPASTDWYTDYSTTNNNMTADPSTSNPYMNSYNNASLSGSMETSGPMMSENTVPVAAPSYFTPTMNMASANSSSSFGEDMENEPPLLEELGINLQQIFMKTKAVVIPFRRFAGNTALMDPSLIVEDADLAGPLVFALALGFELLLGLEVEFGAIYGFGLAGCVSMTLILNLMSPTQAVSFWTVTSILGYALLPVNILAALKILLQNLAGFQTLVRFLAVLTIVWCTTASTRLLEVGCGMAHQRYLIAYPIALLYTAFVLITIF